MAKKTSAAALRELKTLERYSKLSNDDKIRQIRDAESKLERERSKHRETKRKLRQAEDDLVINEEKLGTVLCMQDHLADRKIPVAKKRRGKGQATAIVCCNDWHAEQQFGPSLVNGLNEFNKKIATRRIKRTWEQAVYLIEFARKISKIDEVILWAGGDLMNGMIHEEYQQTNWAGPTVASIFVQQQLIDGIKFLLQNTKCKKFRFLANHGNHGRSTEKKRTHTQWEHSWEYLIYNNVAQAFVDNKRVESFIADGNLLNADIQGHLCRFSHGDTLRYHGGQAGLMGPANKALDQWNAHGHAELTVIGHFHQHLAKPNFVACGSLIGYDPYAASIRAKAESPSQTLIVMDAEHGNIMTARIFCEDKPNANSHWSTPQFFG
jgi:hypothetical protein